MRHAIDSILQSAISTASKRASSADVACAIVAAMRRLRALMEAGHGASAAAEFDDAVRNYLLRLKLREATVRGQPLADAPIPAGGPHAAIACTILEDAMLTCVALQAFVPVAALFGVTTVALVDALVSALGGVPDPATLLSHLRPQDEAGATALTMLPRLPVQ